MILIRDEKLIKAFGKHLRKLRKSSGLSQNKLAYQADVSISQISRLERGLLNPTLSTLYALSVPLDVPLHKMLEFSVE